MASKTWGQYRPSKDGHPETHALRQLRMTTYDAAMSVSAICLRRKMDALQARIASRKAELLDSQVDYGFALDSFACDRAERIKRAKDAVERAELLVIELEAQMEGAIGAAIDRGLIELDD